jgi:agmatine/peptidylarginine deiminase
LITNYYDYDVEYYNLFKRILDKYFEVIPLSYNVKQKHRRSWAYINFLIMGNVLLVPQLGIPEDKQALQQISNILPNFKVIGVPALEAVRRGGALNCISWDVN